MQLTQEQIQQARNQMGLSVSGTPITQSPTTGLKGTALLNELNKNKPSTFLQKAGQFGVGLLKGVGETLGSNQFSTVGITGLNKPIADTAPGQEALKANTPSEQAGKTTEKVAEMFVPLGAEKTVSNLAKTGKTLLRGSENTVKKDFLDKLLTPITEKGKIGLNAIKSGKVTESGGILGKRNFSEALPNYSGMKTSLSEVPGISSKKTVLQNLNAVHSHIGTLATDLETKAVNSGVSFTPAEFNKYMSGVRKTISENPSIVGDAEKSANKIIVKFNSLVKENGYTPGGLLKARKLLDSWIGSSKGSKIFNPTTENGISLAVRGVRQGGNSFLKKLIPDVNVQGLLDNQTNLYNAIDTLAVKAQKEGASYLSRLVGVVRKHPLGSLITAGATAIAGDKAIRAVTGL